MRMPGVLPNTAPVNRFRPGPAGRGRAWTTCPRQGRMVSGPETGTRSGTEPDNARSAVRLRMWLAAIGALLCGVAVLWFVELADDRAGSSKTVLIVLAVAAG